MRSAVSTITLLLAGILAPIPAALGAPSVSTPHERGLLEPIETREDASTKGSRPRAPTCNTPTNRACWASGFNINTDYETSTPNTGVTRPYTLTLTEKDNWPGPDGVVKEHVMLINDKIMGPTIVANWGDWIQVTVINNMRTNGTSIHWHGLHMKGANLHDGTNGVTECPIPPNGKSKVYRFRATQYGSSWYHSHFSAQYGNGVVGMIQINGPASLNYDIDLGVFPVSDYYYQSTDHILLSGIPVPSDNVLFNGTGKHPVTGAGSYANVTLTPGKRHRLRLINPSVENHFQLSLVGHNMTIISADMVPVQPYTVSSLFLGPGQRHDVTIDASQTPGNYWFNVTFGGQNLCGASVNPHPAAIFHYSGAPGGLPTDQGNPSDITDHQCLDLIDLSPVVPRTINPSSFNPSENNTLPVVLDVNGPTPIFLWKIRGNYLSVNWDKPIAEYVMTRNTSYPTADNLVHIPQRNQWVYWLIENDPDGDLSLPHPMHLHGHDFLILARSPFATPLSQTRYVYDPVTDNPRLKGNNPLRRDTVMLPTKGWSLIAFKTDNPGAWLFHCHVAWHVSGGMSVDFLERVDDFRNGISAQDKNDFNRNCANWRSYTPMYPKIDSGV